MPDVLNPLLYRKLKQHFGVVRISQAGQAMVARAVRTGDTSGPRLHIAHAGEQYAVNCPFCTDTRFRLYVSHMYGQRDEFGRKMTFLAICYNDTACMSKYANQLDLQDTLSGGGTSLEKATIYRGDEVPEEAHEISWPGPCTPLDELEDRHPARRYLERRNFDPDRIARLYGAAYCHGSHYYLAKGRIIIPVFEYGKLKGWQARHVGELDWKDKEANHPPKYFTYPGMPRRLLLYNYDRARQYATGVIVEGPTDVWGFGPMAVCTFGSSMTEMQRRKFSATFRRRTAVLLYDPEAFENRATRSIVEFFSRKMPGRFAAVRLPEETDPGSLGRKFLRGYVAAEAEKQGVTVLWEKWRR